MCYIKNTSYYLRDFGTGESHEKKMRPFSGVVGYREALIVVYDYTNIFIVITFFEGKEKAKADKLDELYRL